MSINSIHLLCVRIRNLFLINPVIRLLVLGIINLLFWVHRRVKVLEKAALVEALAVEANVISIVRAKMA